MEEFNTTPVTTADISVELDEWVSSHLDSGFHFRKYQKETCIKVIHNIVTTHRNKNMVYEMPTGFGKSIFAIVCAGVLWEYHKMRSYILASDLSLWEQYRVFIDAHPSLTPVMGYIKGQTGNYTCTENNSSIRNSLCRMCGKSWGQMVETAKFASANPDASQWKCAIDCEYLRHRGNAIKTPVTLMTYQMFLYSVANDADKDPDSHFLERDIIFCDECHNIPSIVQSRMTLTISKNIFPKLKTIYNAEVDSVTENIFAESEYESKVLCRWKSIDELMKYLGAIHNIAKNRTPIMSEDTIFKFIKQWLIDIDMFAQASDKYIKAFKKKGKKTYSKGENDLFKAVTYVQNYFCNLTTFVEVIETTGVKYLVVDSNPSDTSVEDPETESPEPVKFMCAKEDYMVHRFLLYYANWVVMYSATVGGHSAFDDNCGMKYEEVTESEYESIPSTFDFTASPIIFRNRYKMGTKDFQTSFEAQLPAIWNTLRKHYGQHGIVQTGSYRISKMLEDSVPDDLRSRCMFYHNAREKETALSMLKLWDDFVIFGPTLTEGLDMPGDECRFIIILKMPYPYLGDPLVRAKMNLFPKWYQSSTSNAVIQGRGRGIRYDGDWCVTYIYDACFGELFTKTKDQYPETFTSCLRTINR